MKNVRLVQYDILKGIGILLVLIGHTEQLPSSVRELIYAFHMPLFFFLSGVFFKLRSFREVVSKGLRQLIVPWLFFVVVLYVGYLLVSLKAGDLNSFMNFLTQHSSPMDEDAKLWLSIWFLPCLFLVRIFYYTLSITTQYIANVICNKLNTSVLYPPLCT